MALATFWVVVALGALALTASVTYIVNRIDVDRVMQTVAEVIIDSTPLVFRTILCFLVATGIVSAVWFLFV